jgi:UDP-N-acetylmuramate dehydrogenase
MPTTAEMRAHLDAIPNLTVSTDVPLARHTRFGIGGPADLYAEAGEEAAFVDALRAAQAAGVPVITIGGGTNLVASDSGYRGLLLRFRGDSLRAMGNRVTAGAGAELQRLVDFTVDRGLQGLETLAGIPGWTGAAVYGNAGAYGHSISERVAAVRVFDGAQVRELTNAECQFAYRESVFKRHKDWIVFSVELELKPGDREELRRTADAIVKTRSEKFPATMQCAGSVFKNLLLRDLAPAVADFVPPEAVREGKVPAAWFLDAVGAKGLERGDIRVADYHANLIYNAGHGTAADFRALVQELKARVRTRFGFDLEEEVQYIR